MKTFMLALAMAFYPTLVNAQIIHGEEIEIGTDGMGHSFYSQYFLFDFSAGSANAQVRPFVVNGVVRRLEIGGGKKFKKRETVLKLTFGGTTNKEVMTAGLLITHVGKHELMYIADAKWAFGETTTSLYQKAWWALDEQKTLRLRYEQLIISDKVAFIRPGIEYQIQFPTKIPSHLYIAPFFDPKTRHLGGQMGFRFSGLGIP